MFFSLDYQACLHYQLVRSVYMDLLLDDSFIGMSSQGSRFSKNTLGAQGLTSNHPTNLGALCFSH